MLVLLSLPQNIVETIISEKKLLGSRMAKFSERPKDVYLTTLTVAEMHFACRLDALFRWGQKSLPYYANTFDLCLRRLLAPYNKEYHRL